MRLQQAAELQESSFSSESRRWRGKVWSSNSEWATTQTCVSSHVATLDDRSCRWTVLISWYLAVICQVLQRQAIQRLVNHNGQLKFSTLYRTGSQWSCLKTIMMYSRRPVPVTRRAEALVYFAGIEKNFSANKSCKKQNLFQLLVVCTWAFLIEKNAIFTIMQT